ncbi:fungal-specific transcription factor domain-containing protein [Penicillium mononematosum]|uniref:fungal-specific transcription factor domain-containing protein n=1 Tax=Penicillium mononematosum TaxID=268346 RepID=UPI0025483BBB|nr:fungal-specific transcription factor domain-containing protein [Penicillium mononematosum]KAJ6186516.1 fungal-specific transcription factor domain-containing protein [Penicillium mononematosum]
MPVLPPTDVQNDNGSCWTCLKLNRPCDLALPLTRCEDSHNFDPPPHRPIHTPTVRRAFGYASPTDQLSPSPGCRNCVDRGVKCGGFGVKLRFPAELDGTSSKPPRRRFRERRAITLPPVPAAGENGPGQLNSLPLGVSSLALPAEDSFFMQHFLHNVARITLAIDYNENGYRSLFPMAMQEPAVMNGLLAVAASHYSRWQQINDTSSRKYLQAASKALKDRFSNVALRKGQETLAAMLLLVSYEVFSGSSRWSGHYNAIRGFIKSRGDCSDLNPFLKTWVCLIGTQCALNLGSPAMDELESWMGFEEGVSSDQGHLIDALFGCSAKLPRLMVLTREQWAASRLYNESKRLNMQPIEIRERAQKLQEEIRATQIVANSDLSLGILCRRSSQTYSANVVGLEQEELRRRMIATAEIFRHASHIYVFRIAHGPEEPLSKDLQASLRSSLELLTLVPDALGPGANLGWCLVVIGAELDPVDQRDYVRARWEGLHLLGIYNSKNGQKILEEVWKHRDRVNNGQAIPERWQDIMQRIGESQILV